jgi:hypothetical protein
MGADCKAEVVWYQDDEMAPGLATDVRQPGHPVGQPGALPLGQVPRTTGLVHKYRGEKS